MRARTPGGRRVVIVGAGMAGLAAAIDLASAGFDVTLLDRAAKPGGKMREASVGGAGIDSGPTVFTMRWVFESLFADAGASFQDRAPHAAARVLARHAWADGGALDLFADPQQSADAIGALSGPAAARGFLAFCRRAETIHDALLHPFMTAQKPSPVTLAARVSAAAPAALLAMNPFATLWSALGEFFKDQRLRQLFARYATYCGASPFSAPATLMLIAHVEQAGVDYIEGGMARLAEAMAALAADKGATLRWQAEAADIVVTHGAVRGVRLRDGEQLDADAVISAVDPYALGAGLLGAAAQRVGVAPNAPRSLSAVTWSIRTPRVAFPLARHTVFFSGDYRAEFDDVFARGRTPRGPTVYVCAQDRADGPGDAPAEERLFVLTNAPALGGGLTEEEIERCEIATFSRLAASGLYLDPKRLAGVRTTPADFNALFPGSQGALYGRALHGPFAPFQRPGARTAIEGLYLAGGGTHPSAGVPMATISGRLAAAALMQDLSLTPRFRPAGIAGGISTRSRTTAATG